MADNTQLNVGVGGDTYASNDIGGVKHQLVKVEYGASGSATQVSNANPFPITPGGVSYSSVAASQTDKVLGATGATGDYLNFIEIVPATTSPGAVSIKDGSGSAITVFTGGASSVSNLVPFSVAIMAKSTGGAWKVTTGANVSVFASGNFT